ncbi:MAG: S-layer homology domain-containing protein [bacterium]
MKKFQLVALSFLVIFCGVFAATPADESNANFLAGEGIIVDHSSAPVEYRFGDKILRQEIVAIALKMKGVDLSKDYTCKKYFSDVTADDWVCRAVELAADNGIISKSNSKFRPTDFVTRAEALAMLSGVVCLPRLTVREYGFLESTYPDLATQHSNKNDWQKALWESISF